MNGHAPGYKNIYATHNTGNETATDFICEFRPGGNMADRDLIAAAPDLLAELISMTDAYSNAMRDAGVTHYPEALAVVRQARAAIAKAQGGAK